MTRRSSGSHTLIAAHINPVELFQQAEELFEGGYAPERLVAASEERALFVARDLVLKRRVALRGKPRSGDPVPFRRCSNWRATC
ncbi:MAG: hypothetical protein HYW06_03315 [Gemmatimonadetes bacterium]|nr:hypothetical protein [Gemmatimonadota bacterium]